MVALAVAATPLPPAEPAMDREPSTASLLHSLTSRYSDWILEALAELPDRFLITDPSLPGHPIVFASPEFLRMSGYSGCEVLGRNGRIFQGPGTDRRSVAVIREAIRGERPMQISLLNYRKGGEENRILFHMFPVFATDDGAVVHFVSVHVPICGHGRGRRSSVDGRGLVVGTCRGELCVDPFDSDNVVGTCRGELCVDPFFDSDNRVLEAEQLREAGDAEKEKAMNAANNILSALTRYSEVTGRRVSGKRNNVASVAPLSSSLIISLGRVKQSFVLTDPHLLGMPIVYASDAFLGLTGYVRDEVLGQSCTLLNGVSTDVETLNQIKECTQAARSCSVRILYYRKDRNTFWNLLHVSPVRNLTGKIAFYIWVHADENEKNCEQGLSPQMRQLGAVGAVKVAVRSMSSDANPWGSSTR